MLHVQFDGTPVQVLTLVYLVKDGKVLMLERAAHKRFLPGWIVAPGGKVEPGEDIVDAGVREFEEETGLQVKGKVRLRGSYTFMTNKAHNRSGVIYLLEAHGYEGDFKAEVADGTLRWMTPQDIYAAPMVMADHKTFMHVLLESDDAVACIGSWMSDEQEGAVEWADSRAYFEARAEAA